jgi:nitrogen fixation/metabolism regulation signal transduction histidine kinase
MEEKKVTDNTTADKILDESKIYTQEGLLEVIDALPLAIAVIDSNRDIALANKATGRFTNKNQLQLIGHVGGEAFGCIHHDDAPEGCGFGPECLRCKLRTTILTTLEQKEPQHMVETVMMFKTHGERHLRISTLPMILSGDEVVLLAIEDITEVKKREQTAMEKEKFSAVIQTAGAVCHEMNQPLMVIMGFAELLLEDLQEDDIQKENVKEIKKQVERLASITKNLMGITRYKTKGYLSAEIIDIDAAADLDPKESD